MAQIKESYPSGCSDKEIKELLQGYSNLSQEPFFYRKNRSFIAIIARTVLAKEKRRSNLCSSLKPSD
jgi:hypothetical protein